MKDIRYIKHLLRILTARPDPHPELALLQVAAGEHHLKVGEPEQALIYFQSAMETFGQVNTREERYELGKITASYHLAETARRLMDHSKGAKEFRKIYQTAVDRAWKGFNHQVKFSERYALRYISSFVDFTEQFCKSNASKRRACWQQAIDYLQETTSTSASAYLMARLHMLLLEESVTVPRIERYLERAFAAISSVNSMEPKMLELKADISYKSALLSDLRHSSDQTNFSNDVYLPAIRMFSALAKLDVDRYGSKFIERALPVLESLAKDDFYPYWHRVYGEIDAFFDSHTVLPVDLFHHFKLFAKLYLNRLFSRSLYRRVRWFFESSVRTIREAEMPDKDERVAELYSIIARNYEDHQRFAEALECFHFGLKFSLQARLEASRWNPADFQLGIAIVLFKSKDFGRALEAVNEALRLNNGTRNEVFQLDIQVEALLLKAHIHFEAKAYETAHEAYLDFLYEVQTHDRQKQFAYSEMLKVYYILANNHYRAGQVYPAYTLWAEAYLDMKDRDDRSLAALYAEKLQLFCQKHQIAFSDTWQIIKQLIENNADSLVLVDF